MTLRLGTSSLGPLQAQVNDTVERLQQLQAVRRLWQRDYTLWKPDPTEIADRLGWLDPGQGMGKELAGLSQFTGIVQQDGIRHVVLLGMGGSSLGPEVLRQTFGSAWGYPSLMVLDSTVPDWVQAVTQAINPAHTLFLVSSKSGATIEPLSFYKHFRYLVETAVGVARAGQSFAAITDPGTSLEHMGQEQGFRKVFLNPPDIGGRYSILSFFGMVPAALIGTDVELLLARAAEMQTACQAEAQENPGAWLGVAMATLALHGRDKLTIMASPAIASFGLWVEQLIAESTGKEGKGIVPVAGEPVASPEAYGDDRFFVHLRLEGDDNAAVDKAVVALGTSGQPVVRLDLRDRYDLGAEFYRWEFAIAVAGHLLGVNPFDQPDVQAAKDATNRVLARYRNWGHLPRVQTPDYLGKLLEQAKPGDYLAIMAFLRQTPEVDGAFKELRLRVMQRYRIATTLGYGPRFLHSTGQLHKGGPNKGLFLQITQAHTQDVPIPGEEYTFGVLAEAQALGDLHALQAGGRRVAKINLASGYAAQTLRHLVEQASRL